MSRKHLQFIDSLECLICGSKHPTHHHLLRVDREYLPTKEGEEAFLLPKVKSKGMGTKSDDRFCLPLCPICHRKLHDHGGEKDFLRQKGIEKPEEIALALFDVSGDYKKAMQILKSRRLGRV